MIKIRTLHLFLGTFFAPAIIFFALTGLLQVVGLHQAKEKGAPPPHPLIAKLADIHKDQHVRPVKQPVPATQPAKEWKGPSIVMVEPEEPFIPLKVFVLLMALGLIVTSLIGIYIALQNPRTRRSGFISLALGTVIPVLMLYL